MSDSELLIGNKGLFSASKTWKDHQEKFEHNLGTYAYNHPAAKRAANKGLLKLKDTVLKASHAKTTAKEQQVIRDVFFSDKKDSAGQVGKNVSSENIDRIIPRNTNALIDNTSDGNLRSKMTAFMNGAYFHDSGANLKQILKNNTGSFHQLGILNKGTLDLIEKSEKFDSNSLKKIDDEKLKQYKLSKQNSYKSLIQRQKSLSEEASNLKAHFNEQFLSYVKEDIPKFNNKIDMKINTFKNAKDVLNKRENTARESIDKWKLKMKEDLIKRQENVNSYKEKAEQNTRNHYILKFIAKMKNKSLLKKMNLTEEELNHNFYDDFVALNKTNYKKPDYEYQDSPDYALDGSNAEEVSSEKLYKYINDRGSSYDDKLRKRKKDPSKDFDISVLGDLVQFKRITKDEKSRYLYILNRISDLEKLKPTLEFEANLEGDDLRKYYWYLTERTKNNMQDVDMYKWDFIAKSASLEGDDEYNEIINQFMSIIPKRIKHLDQKMQQIDNSSQSVFEKESELSLDKLQKEKKKLQEFSKESLAQKLVDISSGSRSKLNAAESASFTRSVEYYKSIGAELSESELNFLGLSQSIDTKDAFDENQTPTNTEQALPWISGKMSSTLNKESPFYKILTHKKGMNLLTGISGTTARMLQSYKYLGFTSNEDLLNFRLALIGWMVLGEDHSLYEILMGSHMVDVKGDENLSDASTMDKSVSPLSIDELRDNVCEKYDGKGLFPNEICYLEERFDGKHSNGLDVMASDLNKKVKNINETFGKRMPTLSAAEALSIRSYTTSDYKFINHILPLSPQKAELDIENRVKHNIKALFDNDKQIYTKPRSLPYFIDNKIRDYKCQDESNSDNISTRVNNIYNSHPDIQAKHILAVFSSEIQTIAEALKRLPNKYGGTVYRGTGTTPGGETKRKVGDTITFKKLTSTSVDQDRAEDFEKRAIKSGKTGLMYQISTHKKYGIPISSISNIEDECEVLMPPGAKIKITNITTDENGLYMKAEEV